MHRQLGYKRDRIRIRVHDLDQLREVGLDHFSNYRRARAAAAVSVDATVAQQAVFSVAGDARPRLRITLLPDFAIADRTVQQERQRKNMQLRVFCVRVLAASRSRSNTVCRCHPSRGHRRPRRSTDERLQNEALCRAMSGAEGNFMPGKTGKEMNYRFNGGISSNGSFQDPQHSLETRRAHYCSEARFSRLPFSPRTPILNPHWRCDKMLPALAHPPGQNHTSGLGGVLSRTARLIAGDEGRDRLKHDTGE